MQLASPEATGLGHRRLARTLIDERSRLRQELNSALSRRFWDLEQMDDRNSIDTESWHDDELPTLIRRLHADISAAEEALERLRGGLFGICVDCADDIASEQLRISPSRARCIKCER